MENLESTSVDNVVQDNETNESVEVKTFTQEEVNAMIEKRIARESKKIEAEKQKAYELQLKAELEESEKLAKMSEAEKEKAKSEKERKQFEAEREKFLTEMRAFEQEKILNTTMKTLSEKNLPVEFAQFIKADNAEDIMDNIGVFEKHFNEALEKMVTERLKGRTPSTSTVTGKKFDMNTLKGMSVAEINAQWDTIKNNLK